MHMWTSLDFTKTNDFESEPTSKTIKSSMRLDSAQTRALGTRMAHGCFKNGVHCSRSSTTLPSDVASGKIIYQL